MGKPRKDYDEKKVGAVVQTNYKFLDKLFGSTHKALRDSLFECADEDELRDLLEGEGIHVEPKVRIMLVDIEYARTRVYGDDIDTKNEDWYVLVLPPKPQRSTSQAYKDAQAWEAAWYHAANDGYGM